MWKRWRGGVSLQQIAQLFSRNYSSVGGILSWTGGIEPRWRHRSRRTLTLAECEEFSRCIVPGDSLRAIAASLKRSPSTINREIRRNGSRRTYRAAPVDQAAWNRAVRPKACKLIQNRALARLVAQGLRP